MNTSQVEHMTFPRVHMQNESKREAKFWSHKNKTKDRYLIKVNTIYTRK